MSEEGKGKGGGIWNTGFVGTDEVSDKSGPPFQDVSLETAVIPTSLKHNYEPKEERRMMKNVILISCAFTLLFTAFNSMSSLMSSMYEVRGFIK
jgi:hypothetical protein